MMAITVLLAAGFVYFQFRGYGEMIDKGAYATANHIMD